MPGGGSCRGPRFSARADCERFVFFDRNENVVVIVLTALEIRKLRSRNAPVFPSAAALRDVYLLLLVFLMFQRKWDFFFIFSRFFLFSFWLLRSFESNILSGIKLMRQKTGRIGTAGAEKGWKTFAFVLSHDA